MLFLGVLCLCCTRPDVEETFVKAGSVREGGAYPFSVDMADTLCRYDLSFYTRLDMRKSRLEKIGALVLEVEWVSPSGTRYGETLKMPVPSTGSFFSTGAVVPYRTGLFPVEAGKWTLEVRVPDAPEGFRGLGLITSRIDGTR